MVTFGGGGGFFVNTFVFGSAWLTLLLEGGYFRGGGVVNTFVFGSAWLTLLLEGGYFRGGEGSLILSFLAALG